MPLTRRSSLCKSIGKGCANFWKERGQEPRGFGFKAFDFRTARKRGSEQQADRIARELEASWVEN
jgi:hypothetical protein